MGLWYLKILCYFYHNTDFTNISLDKIELGFKENIDIIILFTFILNIKIGNIIATVIQNWTDCFVFM